MPTTTDDLQTVQRPDGKYQQFKKSWSQDRIDKFYIKQGWTKKDGKWLTKSGEDTKDLTKTSAPPNVAGDIGKRVGGTIGPAVADYTTQALPTAGATAGQMVGSRFGMPTTGAAIGGGTGEALKLVLRAGLGDPDQPKNLSGYIKSIGEEAGKQALLEKGGQLVGTAFFKMLSKIPHAAIKDGIPLLPSELKPGGKIMRYIEDLLSNLYHSAGVMENFKVGQSNAVTNKLETLAQGMSKFKGTSEEMGMLLQNVMTVGEKEAQKSVDIARKAYIKKGMSAAQADNALSKTNLYKNFIKEFKNSFAKEVINTNKPELIGGWFRASGTSLEEARTMASTVKELKPEVWGKVQNRIMRDILSESLTGSKDPVAKGTQALTKKFQGDTFKHILDNIGEEKLKTIYGDQGYKNIEEFTKLVGMIGSGGKSGAGKWMNLMLFIGPIRSGFTPKTVAKMGNFAFLINRLAKIVTDTNGTKLANNYVRATISNSPRLINLAIDELREYNKRSDEEFTKDEQEGEEQYERDKELKHYNKKQEDKEKEKELKTTSLN